MAKKYEYPEALSEITGYDEVNEKTLSDILEWAREQNDIVNDIKAAVEYVKDRCKDYMRDNGLTEAVDEMGFPIATLTESERNVFDSKGFALDHPDMFAYYSSKEKMYKMNFKKAPEVYKKH